MLPEAQAYFYKARLYDPVMGRFLQTDPIGQEDDPNEYAYVKGDPTNSTDPSGELAVACSFSEATGSGSCSSSDDGGKDLTIKTSITDKSGNIRSLTKTYSAQYVAKVGSLTSFINAQYRYGLNATVGIHGPSVGSQVQGAIGAALAAVGIGGKATGPVYPTEGDARAAAQRNGWQETNELSPGSRGKFYRDESGNLWTRDRDGHNGGAWKQYDRTGTKRLGTYDADLNRIGK